MKKRQLLLGLFIMIVLCGCGKKEEPVQPSEEISVKGEPMKITAFSFRHTGMSMEECFLYSAEQTKDGIRLYTEELFSGGLIVDTIVDEPILEQLGEMVGKYRLDKWDGFDKTNKHVRDGNSFSLSFTLVDGKTVSAYGNNSFPDGYTDVKREICELFENLVSTVETAKKTTNEVAAETEMEMATTATEIIAEPEAESTQLQNDRETYEDWYHTILDSNYEIIVGGTENCDYMNGTSGIGEVVMYNDENVADIIGYTFLDVNDDSVPELIIGDISEEKEGKYYGQYIYSVYTYKDIPHLLLEGWSRNRCFLLDDGTFYTEGSGGAMYTMIENRALYSNETELSVKDYYFTKEKDESYEEIGFYHNTTGEWDVSASEEIGEDAFWNKSVEYDSRTRTLEFVPFSMYQYSGEQTDVIITEDVVTIEWITEEQLRDSQIWSYVADTSQPQVIAALYANEKVTNFKVLSLTFEDVDDMGNVVFSIEELYHYGNFSPGNPFVITLALYGTIPYYGISYETTDGEIHYYAISESGMDGSAELVKFEPKE